MIVVVRFECITLLLQGALPSEVAVRTTLGPATRSSGWLLPRVLVERDTGSGAYHLEVPCNVLAPFELATPVGGCLAASAVRFRFQICIVSRSASSPAAVRSKAPVTVEVTPADAGSEVVSPATGTVLAVAETRDFFLAEASSGARASCVLFDPTSEEKAGVIRLCLLPGPASLRLATGEALRETAAAKPLQHPDRLRSDKLDNLLRTPSSSSTSSDGVSSVAVDATTVYWRLRQAARNQLWLRRQHILIEQASRLAPAGFDYTEWQEQGAAILERLNKFAPPVQTSSFAAEKPATTFVFAIRQRPPPAMSPTVTRNLARFPAFKSYMDLVNPPPPPRSPRAASPVPPISVPSKTPEFVTPSMPTAKEPPSGSRREELKQKLKERTLSLRRANSVKQSEGADRVARKVSDKDDLSIGGEAAGETAGGESEMEVHEVSIKDFGLWLRSRSALEEVSLKDVAGRLR